MSYVLFLLPIAGLLAIFGFALRAPGEAADSDSAFSYANEDA